jgi:hypothetical protein
VRRDSFDDFIVRRAGALSAKSATPAPAAAVPGSRAPVAWQLRRAAEEADAAATTLHAATATGDAAVVTEALAGVARAAHRLCLLAGQRQEELGIVAGAAEGTDTGSTGGDAAARWAQELAIATEGLAAAVGALPPLAAGPTMAVAHLSPALEGVAAATAKVLAAARHPSGLATPVWHRMYETARTVGANATALVRCPPKQSPHHSSD